MYDTWVEPKKGDEVLDGNGNRGVVEEIIYDSNYNTFARVSYKDGSEKEVM